MRTLKPVGQHSPMLRQGCNPLETWSFPRPPQKLRWLSKLSHLLVNTSIILKLNNFNTKMISFKKKMPWLTYLHPIPPPLSEVGLLTML